MTGPIRVEVPWFYEDERGLREATASAVVDAEAGEVRDLQVVDAFGEACALDAADRAIAKLDCLGAAREMWRSP